MAKSPEKAAVKLAFGLRVKAARQARGLTQQVLAEYAGLDPTTISKIETGRGNPRLLTMNSLALALEVPFDGFYPCRAGLRETRRLAQILNRE